jgi:hypothetical protein
MCRAVVIFLAAAPSIFISLAQKRVFLLDINPVFAALFCLIGRRFPSRGDPSSEQSEVSETVPMTEK